MAFDPTLASIRFGMGLSVREPAVQSMADMLETLAGPDLAAQNIPIQSFFGAAPDPVGYIALRQAEREAGGTSREDAAKQARLAWTNSARAARRAGALAGIARAVNTQDGLRERLVAFWADHFSIESRQPASIHLVAPFVEDGIRPFVAGRFVDMLKAVTTHPMMLSYLQQAQSVGPNSQVGQRRNRGINENLARELLELHTLGVDGQYTQFDVQELAQLLTGLTYQPKRGMRFDPRMSEPGAKTVLGVIFDAEPSIEVVHDLLETLARHPDTAQHIARKLAVHFVSDTPDDALISRVARRFLETDGDLLATIEALLESPLAWSAQMVKVKRPYEFVISSFRALGLGADQILGADRRAFRRIIDGPLRAMGQPLERPPGPNGWPEDAEDWVIPQSLAARISWAFQAPEHMFDQLPDPRDFVDTALGHVAPQSVRFAAAAAEKRADGIGVVLASAAFQRR